MMKSKSIFIVLLFSLFLNIGHDFFIKNQVEPSSMHTLLEVANENSSEQLDRSHHFFHFVAIVSSSDFLEKKLITKRTFTSQDLPFFIGHPSPLTRQFKKII